MFALLHMHRIMQIMMRGKLSVAKNYLPVFLIFNVADGAMIRSLGLF